MPAPNELLRQAIKAGASLGDFLLVYSEESPDGEYEQHMIQRAIDVHHREGELEIDDYAMVSGSADDGGEYVLAWVWVEHDSEARRLLGLEETEAWV